jgi:hypothetical protein
MLMKPLWMNPGLTRTFGVPQVSLQGSQVVPAGQARLATQRGDPGPVEQMVVTPASQAQAPHTLVYLPPAGAEQRPPTEELAGVQPPQGLAAVSQVQVAVAQLNCWFAEQGRVSFWQVLSEDRYSWPPKQVVPDPAVGQAHVPCVLL